MYAQKAMSLVSKPCTQGAHVLRRTTRSCRPAAVCRALGSSAASSPKFCSALQNPAAATRSSSVRTLASKPSVNAAAAADAPEAAPTESLPRWDLERWFGFESPYDESIDDKMAELECQCRNFKETFDSKLDTKLYDAIVAYEDIDKTLTTLLSYVMLAADVQMANQDMSKRKAALMQQYSGFSANYLTFFSLQLADLEDDALEVQYKATPELKQYAPFIEDTRRSKPYNLSAEVERALSVRAPFSGKGPVVEYYGKELSYLRFDLDGEEVNLEVILSKMSVSKDAEERSKLMKIVNDGLMKFERTAALSLNMVAGSWHVENNERSFSNLRSSRNLSNNVPDEVVDSLIGSVGSTGVEYCKRFYKLKKDILKATQGLEKFSWADRNAPLSIGTSNDSYTWDEAVEIVRAGYAKFSPVMADMFMDMVKEKRIDVPATNGKRGGAYCAAAWGSGPFQLLNFNGTQRDVATLAHESGHGCHNILSYDQGILQFHPPLTLAEVASIFGEMIVFRDLLDKCPSKEDRLAMLLSKIDDIVNSVVRQVSFDKFEETVHMARANGQLTPEDMNKAWSDAMCQFYGQEGEVFDTYQDTSHLWTYVSHFHNVPFYVYSYAFADLVVGSLYGVYQKSPEGFEDKLLALLRAGGTKDFVTALAPFGLDPSDPEFWQQALDAHLGGLMEEAEDLSKELGYC
mmetsp:Transcript_25525/g.30979  ORF Transcript_25525/g.30979 Transcript_25525/m.30979 type:complete len:688 (-) Transcript_25525:67-2130(-)